MESAVTSQESDTEVQSEAGPGEVAGAEVETTGQSTQSTVCETPTAAAAAQVPARTVPAPTKRAKRPPEHRDEQLLSKASEMLTAISASISRKEAEQPQAPNTTRIFCDMLYGELMSIADVRAREQLQYQLHSVVMRHKYPEMFPHTPSQYTPLPFTMQPMEPETVTFHAPAAAAPTRAASAPIFQTGFPVPPLHIPPVCRADPESPASRASASSFMSLLYEDPTYQ